MNLTQFEKSKILLVDDKPENLKVLLGYLQDFGFKISIAQSGEEALKLVERFTPDLILLDVMMPGINGFETCRRLKENEATKDIPVIFMTALTDTMDKVKGFEAGGVDYITKPLRHEEVLARVNAHLTIRKLQVDLQQKNEELQKLNTNKDKFFSIIAHDLRSPFSGLLGITEIIIQNIDSYSKDNIKDIIIKLKESAEKLFKLLENLLTWSRIQRGLIEYHPQQIDIQHLVAHNVLLFTSTADQKKILLKNLIEDSTPVYADANMVDTVVRNLISNGLKFTHADGEITISATQGEHDVTVSVSDTGIGIREEKVSTLFRIDAKYQRRGTAGETGTGLGLILCKELVEKNGGKIWVESEEGKGTTFRFTLPKKPVERTGD